MLSAEELCDICATTPAQRQAWARAGDLRQRRGFEELDAAELATYKRLRDIAGPKRGKAAWRDLRSQIQQFLVNPPKHLWVIVETEGVQRHSFAVRPLELAQRVARGQPLVVVDLLDVIKGARSAHRDALAAKSGLTRR